MARAHKKRHGSSGRRGGNQSSNSQMVDEGQSLISEIDRNAKRTEQQTRSFNTGERRFNLVVDSVPYMVSAKPFRFNGEVRYRVSVNGGFEHVFTWDSSLGQLRAIDDDASTLPDNVEEAISEKLQSKA